MRFRLFLSFLFVILISTISIVFLTRWQATIDLRRFVSRGGFAGLENLVNSLENYYDIHQSWDGVETLFQNIRQHQGSGGSFGGPENRGLEERFRLFDPAGVVVLDTSQPNFLPLSSVSIADEDKDRAIPLQVNRRIVGYLLPSQRPIIAPNIEITLVNLINRGAVLAAAISGVIAILLALILGYIILRPVHALTHAAAALGQGDLSQRVNPEGDDEIASLAHTFNLMAESLEQAEARRKAMTADIAHELRTPLSVQRANLEALQDGIYPLTTEYLQPIYEQTLQLERLVDDLRTLALADAGQIELVRTATDIPGLIQRVVELFQPQAGAGNHQIEIILPQDAECPQVSVDPGRIEQILGNLLANAFRHTPDGGQITLEIRCAPTEVRISIRDTGPGIPENVLPYIFERFYRGDASRARLEGGTGLGLSIARRLAESHGGTLEAANHRQGGAVFTLTLPAG